MNLVDKLKTHLASTLRLALNCDTYVQYAITCNCCTQSGFTVVDMNILCIITSFVLFIILFF